MKLVDPAQLVRAREEKRAALEARAAQKAASVEAARAKQRQRLERGRLGAGELFRPPTVPAGTYGSWDAHGVPLTDGAGQALSKNAAKKAQKEWAAQEKLHAEFLVWEQAGRP